MKPTQGLLNTQRGSNKNEFVFVILTFVTVFCFSMLYINRFATDVSGWNIYCAELHHMGEMPYRDFFYYVPPAYLLKLEAVWYMVGRNMILLRAFGLIERALIFVILYLVLRKFARPLHAYIAVFAGFLLAIASGFDAFGDYTQFCWLFVVLGAYCVTTFFEHSARKSKWAGAWLAAAFVFAVQAVMTKQSIGIIFIFMLFVLLLVYMICQRSPNWWKWLLCAIGGALVGLVPWLIWLAANGALEPFIDQVFSSAMDSKGLSASSVVADSVIAKSLSAIFEWEYVAIGASSFIAFLFLDWCKSRRVRMWGAGLSFGVAGVFFLYLLIPTLDNFDIMIARLLQWPAVMVVLALCVLLAVWYFSSRKGRSPFTAALVCGAAFFASWIVVSFLPSDEINNILSMDSISDCISVVGHAVMVLCIFLCVRYLILGLAHRMETRSWCSLGLIIAGLSIALASLFGSGINSFSSGGVAFVIVPAAICILLSGCDWEETAAKTGRRVFKYGITRILCGVFVVLLCGMSLMIMAEKMNSPYSWWGWGNSSITEEDQYTIDYDMYDGMRVSKSTKTMLEEVGKLVEKNSDEDDFVFVFPYSVIYKIQAERYNDPTFTPVYFFDVCPDERALADLEIIKQDMPEIIVWKDVGEACWDTHERLFRSGNRLGQRDIQDWYESVKDTEYELIGQIGNQSVYKLIDGTPVNYTYFEDEEELVSNQEETDTNIAKPNYTQLVLDRSLPEQADTLYMVIVVICIISIALCLLYGGELWIVLSGMISSIYITQACGSIVLLAYVIPLIALLASNRLSWKWKALPGIAMGTMVVLFFVSWSDAWAQGGWEASWVLAIILLVLAVALSVRRLVRCGKEEPAKEGRRRFISNAVALAACVLIWVAAGAYYAAALEPERNDMAYLQDLYIQVYNLRHNEEYQVLENRDESILSRLGADGEKLSDFSDELQQLGGPTFSTDVQFQSKELEGLTADNVFIRISGDSICVWAQENTELGNSGDSFSGLEGRFRMEEADMADAMNLESADEGYET